MSVTPNALRNMLFVRTTGAGELRTVTAELHVLVSSKPWPQGNLSSLPPSDAYSNCASVGNVNGYPVIELAHLQNPSPPITSSQDTLTIGWSSFQPHGGASGRSTPVALQYSLHIATVTGVAPIKNLLKVTAREGRSLVLPKSVPITNVPSGMRQS